MPAMDRTTDTEAMDTETVRESGSGESDPDADHPESGH